MNARLTLLAALTPVTILVALMAGNVWLGPTEVWRALQGESTPLARTVLFELRGPRVLLAYGVGGLLALAGVLMQALLRNPLADPYVLGISGGAAVGALLVLVIGGAGATLGLGAGGGALMSLGLLVLLARHTLNPLRLLLTGVALAAGWGALISLLLTLSADSALRGMIFWLLGDMSHTTGAGWAWLALSLGIVLTLPLARDLNVLVRGDVFAATLGVNVPRLRLALFIGSALLTAVAVALAGPIGFVGLVIPHALRLIGLRDHRQLLLAAPLAGGALLTLADTLARTVVAPQQLPIGALTAAIGVPWFLYLLGRAKGDR